MTFYSFPLNGATAPAGIRREMDRLVNEVFGAPRTGATTDAGWTPTTDAIESSDAFVLTLDIPGVSSDQVEVLAEDGVLTVRGERTQPSVAEGSRTVFSERRAGRFERRFRLPKMADTSGIEATYLNGVLTVRVAKIAPAQPRRVEVRVDRGPVAEQLTGEAATS